MIPSGVSMPGSDAVGPAEAWEAVYDKAANLHWTQLDAETVILNLESGAYFTLNLVGSVAWESIDGTHSLQDVLEAIRGRFDVDPETARHDLLGLIATLREEHLIVQTEGRT